MTICWSFLVCLANVRFLGKKNPQPCWLGLRIGKSLVVLEGCAVSEVVSFWVLADSNENNCHLMKPLSENLQIFATDTKGAETITHISVYYNL